MIHYYMNDKYFLQMPMAIMMQIIIRRKFRLIIYTYIGILGTYINV